MRCEKHLKRLLSKLVRRRSKSKTPVVVTKCRHDSRHLLRCDYSRSYSAPLINTSYNTTETTDCGNGSHLIGTYYNYRATSAGGHCYGSDASSLRFALSTPLSDIFDSGSAYSQGSYGYFWSSTRRNTRSIHQLYASFSSINPSNVGYRYDSRPVGCVAR